MGLGLLLVLAEREMHAWFAQRREIRVVPVSKASLPPVLDMTTSKLEPEA
jgi:hypothetical protein